MQKRSLNIRKMKRLPKTSVNQSMIVGGNSNDFHTGDTAQSRYDQKELSVKKSAYQELR